MSAAKTPGMAVALAAFCLALPLSIAGINIAAGALAVLVLKAALSGRPPRWEALRQPAMKALLLYCAAGLIASLAGQDPSRSLPLVVKDLHKVWILGLLLLALSLSPSPQAYQPLAAGFSLAAVVGLWQVATQTTGSDAWLRAHAFVHPVTFGEQMVLALLGGLCFWNRLDAQKPRARGLAAVFLATVGLALVLNQTRSALIGLAAGFLALAAADKRLRRYAAWAAGAGLLVILLWEFMPTGGRSLRELLGNGTLWMPDGKLNPHLARLGLWKVAIEAFLDNPWTGVGPGNYRSVFMLYFQGGIDGENVWGSAHNLYLHQLAERGLLGFAALAAALFALSAQAWQRARANPNPWTLWAWASMAAFLVMNLTEVAFQNEQMTALVLFAWAWSAANAREGVRRI